MSKRKNNIDQPRVRSTVAQAAHFRSSAGAMGGGKAARNKRDRAATRQALRGER